MVITSNRWSNLLDKVCLKIAKDEAEDKKHGSEKEMEDEYLTRSWKSLVMIRGC